MFLVYQDKNAKDNEYFVGTYKVIKKEAMKEEKAGSSIPVEVLEKQRKEKTEPKNNN